MAGYAAKWPLAYAGSVFIDGVFINVKAGGVGHRYAAVAVTTDDVVVHAPLGYENVVCAMEYPAWMPFLWLFFDGVAGDFKAVMRWLAFDENALAGRLFPVYGIVLDLDILVVPGGDAHG